MLRSSNGTSAGLVDLDEGPVDEKEFTLKRSSKLSKDFGQETVIYPAATTTVDCVPTSPMRRKLAIDIPPAGGEGLPGVHGQRRVEVFQYSAFSPFSINLVGPI
jgi:hypothetical protein